MQRKITISMFNTPILFLVFNRLDTTKQVFAKIREIQPRQLFIGADGARPEKEGEKEKVEAVRKYILDNIDWDCEVKTLFREKNLGCGVAVSEAITWFFENVEQGIILEDDTLPDLSFFTFCEELLNYYKDDERVMHIGGNNSQQGKKICKESYYFSKYPHIWGWASWRRSVDKFSIELNNTTDSDLYEIFRSYNFSDNEIVYWKDAFNFIKNNNEGYTWDIQWTFASWIKKGISIVPSTNLILNIGVHADGTHTKDSPIYHLIKKSPLKSIYTISHPSKFIINKKADDFTFKKYNLLIPPWRIRMKNYLSNLLPNSLKKFIKKLLK